MHANSRANHAAAMHAKRRLREIAAHHLGGSPEDYGLGNERTFRKGASGRGLPPAQAAARAIELGGKYDGHELPNDINAMMNDTATRWPASAFTTDMLLASLDAGRRVDRP